SPLRVNQRYDNGLQGRRREMVLLFPRYANEIANPHVQTGHLGDLTATHRGTSHRRTVGEHRDTGNFASEKTAADPQHTGEHPDVSDLLPRTTAFDLEHDTGHRPVVRKGSQASDSGDEFVDAVTGHG